MSVSKPSPFEFHSDLPIQYEVYPFIESSRFKGKLSGKVVLITGTSVGLGNSAARAFASAGANVACIARRKPENEALATDLKERYNVQAIAVEADVVDPNNPNIAKEVVERVQRELGPIDILVNNAGISRIGALYSEDDFSHWWRVMEVNVRGVVAFSHAVLPSMVERKSGIIMSISSRAAVVDLAYGSAYSASKAAVIKFHQSMALETEHHNILSFSIHPGAVKSEIARSPNAVNMQSVEKEPELQRLLGLFGSLKFQSADLMGATCVALCADERCKVLNGRYIDCEQPLDKILEEAEKEGGGRIVKEDMYRLKMDHL